MQIVTAPGSLSQGQRQVSSEQQEVKAAAWEVSYALPVGVFYSFSRCISPERKHISIQTGDGPVS